MLYDRKWDRQPSLDGFKAWVTTQDPARKYDFLDSGCCAMAQYLDAIGYDHWKMILNNSDNEKLLGSREAAVVISVSESFGELGEKLRDCVDGTRCGVVGKRDSFQEEIR